MHQELFELLKKDHEEVKSLLKQLKETKNGDAKKREELFAEVKKEIQPHQAGEEKAFYPVLKENEETKEDVLESIEEHHVSKLVLRELDGMNKDSDQWLAKLKVFKEIVEHHIQEEEKEIFEDAKKAISDEQMKSIIENFKKEKEAAKSQVS
ncbi:MAG: hemerythrin domain-containing protein [Thermodesulfobacteriota bacterium]